MGEVELERQKERIKKGALVVRECEHPFAEDLIADGAGVVDPLLPVAEKVSCLLNALKKGSSYELVENLLAQFVLIAGRVNTQVAWTRDDVLVSSVKFRSHFVSFQLYIVVLLFFDHFNRNAARNSVTRAWVGSGSPFVQVGIQRAWCDTVNLHKNMGEGHISSGCGDRVSPFLQQCNARMVSARVSCGCCWWFGVPCCCFWRVARVS